MALTTTETKDVGRAFDVEQKVNRLSAAAVRKVVEPDTEVPGSIGEGQLIPDQLLSTAGLSLSLSEEQKARLSREEIASITAAGIRFEAVLEAGFAAHLAVARNVSDPRFTFILHEMGEETRHQRLFQRLLDQCAPQAPQAVPMWMLRLGYRTAVELSIANRAFFYTMVLAGEEIPDLFQKYASELPGTDDFVRAVNKYHRMEEARHLSFARAVFGEVWEKASALDKRLVRSLAPRFIRLMFDMMVHPGVYDTVGLPAFETWRKVNRTPQRRQLRFDSTRAVLEVLLDNGVMSRGSIPRPWRELCGVSRTGAPLDVAPRLSS